MAIPAWMDCELKVCSEQRRKRGATFDSESSIAEEAIARRILNEYAPDVPEFVSIATGYDMIPEFERPLLFTSYEVRLPSRTKEIYTDLWKKAQESTDKKEEYFRFFVDHFENNPPRSVAKPALPTNFDRDAERGEIVLPARIMHYFEGLRGMYPPAGNGSRKGKKVAVERILEAYLCMGPVDTPGITY